MWLLFLGGVSTFQLFVLVNKLEIIIQLILSKIIISFKEKVEYELALAMIGKFCAAGSYAIIYLYSSELFPTSIRNSCMGSW